MREYDPACFVTLAGNRVYFGSSSDHAVHCLDADTGNELWTQFAEAPVRFPPTVAGEHALFCADDGYAMCVRADTGEITWRFSPRPDVQRIINNGNPISPWSCRTGVLVQRGAAYFGASLLPWRTSYLVALDAATGTPDGPGRFVREF